MSYTQNKDGNSIKKTRLIYLWYFGIGLFLTLAVFIIPFCINLVDESKSYFALLPLLFIPILLYYAYQYYALFTKGEMSVYNGVIYYKGYDKGWFPKKTIVEIPLQEIRRMYTMSEELTLVHSHRLRLLDTLYIKTDKYSTAINVSYFAKTELLKSLTRNMLQNQTKPASNMGDITVNIHRPSQLFFPKFLRIFLNGREMSFDKKSLVYSFEAKNGDLLSIKYSDKFIIQHINEGEDLHMSIDTLM